MSIKDDSFMEWVEVHERAWGTEVYTGRPSLDDIMNAACVTFWRPLRKDKHLRYIIRLYSTQAQLEHYLIRLMFKNDSDRLSRIFIHQQLYAIKSVRLKLEKVDVPT